MSENCSQRPVTAMAMSPWLWWTGLFLLLALGPTSAVLSQEFPPTGPQYFSSMGDAVADSYEAQSGFLYSDVLTGRNRQSFGAVVRGGYVTGPTVGRDQGVAPLEFMPYAFLGDGMFFADLRGFRGDRGEYGANLGLGYRQYIEPLDRIFGVNFFYDLDNTPFGDRGSAKGNTFNQLGFGLETYGDLFDIRANAYFPTGERNIFLDADLVAGSPRFVDNELRYDVRNFFLSSLLGAEGEIGFLLPGPFAAQHDLRLYGGGYHYETDGNLKFAGGSVRLQGNPIPSVQMQLLVTHDDVFSTNVMFSAMLSWGGFRLDPGERPSQFARMTVPVQRKYAISTTNTAVVVRDVLAINPSTGEAYFFKHVASPTSLLNDGTEIAYNTDSFAERDGTVEHPYLSIDEAELRRPSAPGDITFVHADSFYDGDTVTLRQGVDTSNGTQELHIRYLGNGFGDFNVLHTITVADVDIVPLPTRQTGADGEELLANDNEPVIEQGDRPLYIEGAGNGVTLASFAEFSGFQVGNPDAIGSGPTGHGSFGVSVESVQLNQNVFAYAQGDGMRFEDVLDSINVIDTNIINSNGVGLRITGGTPGITFGASEFDPLDPPATGLIISQNEVTPINLSLFINNTLDGTDIDMQNSQILNGFTTPLQTRGSPVGAIRIVNTDGNIVIGQAQIINPQAEAIAVLNVAGSVDFVRSISITAREATGIDLRNNSGMIRFVPFEQFDPGSLVPDTDSVFITWEGGPDTTPAINWQGNEAGSSVIFSRPIEIFGSGGDGIALGTTTGNAGAFQATGGVTIAATDETDIPILGVGVNIANNTGPILFNRSGGNATALTVNNRVLEGIQIAANDGPVVFAGLTNIENDGSTFTLPSTEPAVNIHDNLSNLATVTFNQLLINNALQVLPGATDGLEFITQGAGLSIDNQPARVLVQELDVNDTIGISLYANNVRDETNPNDLVGLVINSQLNDGSQILGNTELPAVWIQDSIDQVILARVESADSLFDGIYLWNNTDGGNAEFGFQINNDEEIQDDAARLSGGFIADAGAQARVGTIPALGAGVYAVNAGRIRLNYVDISDNVAQGVFIAANDQGVDDLNRHELFMLGNEVIDNGEDGVLAINIREVTIQGDVEEVGVVNFDSNGTFIVDADNSGAIVDVPRLPENFLNVFPSNHQIQLVSTEPGEPNNLVINEWLIENLEIVHDLPNAAVFARTATAGATTEVPEPDAGHSELEFIVTGNVIELQAAGNQVILSPTQANLDPVFDPDEGNLVAVGVFALWNGPILENSEISLNDIEFLEGGAIGIAVRETSTDEQDAVNLLISQNILTGDTGNNVGIYYDNENASTDSLEIVSNLINLTGSPEDDDNFATFEVGIMIENLETATEIIIQSNEGTIISDFGIAVGFNRLPSGFGDFRGITEVPATYQIGLNEFTMQTFTIDQTAWGFILGTPVGGDVQLIDSGLNVINFVNTVNGIPVLPATGGNFNGTINVNGVDFPQ